MHYLFPVTDQYFEIHRLDKGGMNFTGLIVSADVGRWRIGYTPDYEGDYIEVVNEYCDSLPSALAAVNNAYQGLFKNIIQPTMED